MPSSTNSLYRRPRTDLASALADRLSELDDSEFDYWTPQDYQQPPPEWVDHTKRGWLFLAGRGTGKTDVAAHVTNNHAMGPPCDRRVPGGHLLGIMAPTLGDALASCVNGPSGLRAHNPDVRAVQAAGGTIVRWPNGAEARVFGAYTPEDVERFRAGGNRCFDWIEELAAWRQLDAAWEQRAYGFRLGPRPQYVVSTTPRFKRVIRDLVKDSHVVVTHATTDQNKYLAQEIRDELFRKYGGTRKGRQELMGELLEDVEGALWRNAWFEMDAFRLTEAPPDDSVRRTVVALDPAGGSDTGDEQAITVACRLTDGRFVVLHSEGMRTSPDLWLRHALELYRTFDADALIYEKNYGDAFLKAMIERTIAEDRGLYAHHDVRASKGKRTRAEPIAMLYEQGKVSHLGAHDDLEEQMLTYTGLPGESSPDRLDATVWALTELAHGPGTMSVPSGQMPKPPLRPRRGGVLVMDPARLRRR